LIFYPQNINQYIQKQIYGLLYPWFFKAPFARCGGISAAACKKVINFLFTKKGLSLLLASLDTFIYGSPFFSAEKHE